MDQILPYKDGDLVKARDVYSGPLGDGYADVQYRTVIGDSMGDIILERKSDNVGPDASFTHDWIEIEQRLVQVPATVLIFEGESGEYETIIYSTLADTIISVLNGECVWLENIGAQLSDSYKAAKIAELEGV